MLLCPCISHIACHNDFDVRSGGLGSNVPKTLPENVAPAVRRNDDGESWLAHRGVRWSGTLGKSYRIIPNTCFNGRMKCLYVDIASHEGLLACSDGESLQSKRHCNGSVRDDALLALYTDVMEGAEWSHADLTHIACVTGPGGFTSLRIAVAFCNTIASELGIPSAGIHLADVYAARARGQSPLLWIHSTKKHEVFACRFGAGTGHDAQHLSLQLLLAHMPQQGYWCGELIPQHREAVQATSLPEAVLQETRAIVPALVAEAAYDTNILVPWYGRGG